MLYKEVEDMKGQALSDRTGVCLFCGQTMAHSAPQEWDQKKVDELVTELCDCIDAKVFFKTKSRQERVDGKIDDIFLDVVGSVGNDVVDILHQAVVLIMNHHIQKIIIETGQNVKAVISINSDGKIKVSRTDTRKNESEL